MATLFVSDVHLSRERPATVTAFIDFLDTQARKAERLYILGDLFDEWLGDDDTREPHRPVTSALRRLTASGVPVQVVRGNHDFLLGNDFVLKSGCELLGDHTVIDLYGAPTLIMHGDTLCTADVAYQKFRKTVRDAETQRRFLSLPLQDRAEQASAMRAQSRQATQLKAEDIMDVTPDAVTSAMHEHDVRCLIHGHTHRPAVHEIAIAGSAAKRIVLGDWYEQDSVLAFAADGFELGRISGLEP